MKYAENKQFDAACRNALKQIQQNEYVEQLQEEEFSTILQYGIACYKKQCRVMVRK